jgi:hypothetical protein
VLLFKYKIWRCSYICGTKPLVHPTIGKAPSKELGVVEIKKNDPFLMCSSLFWKRIKVYAETFCCLNLEQEERKDSRLGAQDAQQQCVKIYKVHCTVCLLVV